MCSHCDLFEVETRLDFVIAGIINGGASVNEAGISHEKDSFVRFHETPSIIVLMFERKPSKTGSVKETKRVIDKIKYHPSKLEDIISSIYCYYDCDRSDFLKKTEFAKVLTKLIRDMGGDTPSLEDIEDIMYDLDANGDGQISKSEFKLLMEKVIDILGNDVREARFMGGSPSI